MATPTVFSDSYVVAKRNIIKIKRVPDLLVFTTLSPIMFVLLFAYVFGGAIAVPGGADPAAYREFLMAGIFAQTVIFGATITGAGPLRTSRRASSTGSARSPWPRPRSSRVGRSRTSRTTSSSWSSCR